MENNADDALTKMVGTVADIAQEIMEEERQKQRVLKRLLGLNLSPPKPSDCPQGSHHWVLDIMGKGSCRLCEKPREWVVKKEIVDVDPNN